MSRITKQLYKTALKRRYLDLQDVLRHQAAMRHIRKNDKTLREMWLIEALAKLHAIDIDSDLEG